MPPMRLYILLALSALCLPLHANAQVSAAAQEIINKARQAQGGVAAWNSLVGLHEVWEGAGRFERWADPLRYGLRTETTLSSEKVTQGYNGAGEWRVLPDGTQTGSIDRPMINEARTDAFLAAYGYFFPGRYFFRADYEGVRQSSGQSYDVVEIHPEGGEPRQIWFDRRTGLPGVIVDGVGLKQGRTELSDYRRSGAVTVAFRSITYAAGQPSPIDRKMSNLSFGVVDRGLFSLPPPNAP